VYVVDTNVISEPTRRAPSRAVMTWLSRSAVVSLASISVLELEARVAAATGPKRERLEAWLEGLLESGVVEVVPVDTTIARIAGRLRAERRQRPVATEDLLIASRRRSRHAQRSPLRRPRSHPREPMGLRRA
jgi:hypothetical protein